MEDFTNEEITILKQVASAFAGAKTIGTLNSVSPEKTMSEMQIEVFVDNASKKANLGDVVLNECVPLSVNVKNAESGVTASYIIVYDSGGSGHLVPVSVLNGD